MPEFPRFSSSVTAMPGAVYSAVTARLAGYSGEVYPLNVGDTWMEPPAGCRMEDLSVLEHPGLHRYTPPAGLPELRRAIAERTEASTNLATQAAEVLVGAGATAALSTVVGALLDPGDEVLLMAPYWPLIAGMVTAFRGVPVAVPFFSPTEAPATAEEAVQAFARRRTDRSVAIYLNSPHNPSGRVLPPEWAKALVAWAREEGLWILSDEVYEPFTYGTGHLPLRPLAPEKTVTIHSFSKAYGMTGNRCGYLVGPRELIQQCNKIGTHTYYCAPRAGQLAARAALESVEAASWLAQARDRYAELGRRAARILGLPPPEGSTFFFLDLAGRLDERGLMGFLEDCADQGILLAPGPSFGPFPTCVRVCFTCAEPAVVLRGFEKLAGLLETTN